MENIDFKSMTDEEYNEYLKKRTAREGIAAMAAAGYVNTPLGDATDIGPNEKYREHGLFCRFEHCINNMPAIPAELAAFGQAYGMLGCPSANRAMCPGGIVQVVRCFGKPAANPDDTKEGRQAAATGAGVDAPEAAPKSAKKKKKK